MRLPGPGLARGCAETIINAIVFADDEGLRPVGTPPLSVVAEAWSAGPASCCTPSHGAWPCRHSRSSRSDRPPAALQSAAPASAMWACSCLFHAISNMVD